MTQAWFFAHVYGTLDVGVALTGFMIVAGMLAQLVADDPR